MQLNEMAFNIFMNAFLSRVPWSQFKSYFIFKLEKVMDDFKATAPEQRGPSNPNVECIPFEEMKARILKIVNGYTGYETGQLNVFYVHMRHLIRN